MLGRACSPALKELNSGHRLSIDKSNSLMGREIGEKEGEDKTVVSIQDVTEK